jgi:hypothetical protein
MEKRMKTEEINKAMLPTLARLLPDFRDVPKDLHERWWAAFWKLVAMAESQCEPEYYI